MPALASASMPIGVPPELTIYSMIQNNNFKKAVILHKCQHIPNTVLAQTVVARGGISTPPCIEAWWPVQGWIILK